MCISVRVRRRIGPCEPYSSLPSPLSPRPLWRPGGVLFATTRHELRDLHREMSVTSTTYGVDYCPTILGCDGCGSRQREGPEMWALIATVQLW